MATAFVLKVLRTRPLVRYDRCLPLLLNSNNIKQSIKNLSISQYCSTSDNAAAKTKDLNDTDGSEKSTNKVEEIKITLLLPDNNLMVTDLENATKISKRRGLVLIKTEDVQKKTSRPVYKLINQTELLKQELDDDKNEKKDEKGNENENIIKTIKTIQISSKITQHDMNVKFKNVVKLLEKRHKVKIICVHSSNMQDKILKGVEASVKNYGTIQRTVKSTSTVFTITPILRVHNNDSGDVENKKE